MNAIDYRPSPVTLTVNRLRAQIGEALEDRTSYAHVVADRVLAGDDIQVVRGILAVMAPTLGANAAGMAGNWESPEWSGDRWLEFGDGSILSDDGERAYCFEDTADLARQEREDAREEFILGGPGAR